MTEEWHHQPLKKQTTCLHIRSVASIDIEFEDLKYTVPQKNGSRNILKGVSGCLRSGELTAIMGPSGAGKSSLLNILTGFREAEGTIRSRRASCSGKGVKKYAKHSCYILQDNSLDPLFTVEETMNFAADLKLSRDVSKQNKQQIVYGILEALKLLPCRNTRCSMISGGQQKRLCVALELIGNPSIMFLDEPTTGLDSASSHQVISMLKSLAEQGRNIVCTIHQPSAALFELFDFIYVVADGRCIYQGSSRNVVSYLASFGLNCPKYHNPADYLLEVANGDYGDFTDVLEIKGRVNTWRNIRKDEDLTERNIPYKEIEDDHLSTGNSPSELYKLCILMKRSIKKMKRDWTISTLKTFLHLCVGIFLGLTYLNVGNDASKMIKNLGFLLVTIVYLGYTSLMPAVLKFPAELNILKRERFNNWYNLKTYYTAFLLIDLPMQLIFVLAYISGSYLLSAQPLDLSRFLMVVLVLFFVCAVASSMGVFFGTIVNPINGTFFGAITLALMLSVAGFLLLFTHMSNVMYSLTYISYLSYAMDALAQSIYGYDRPAVPCPESEEICLFVSPIELLREVGMDKPNFWNDIVFLGCNMIFLRLVSFCTLKKTLAKV
ncbi:ATP-binding cassette sub-family G member 1-like [Harmonia axyridis]|uniref:ATP-binding cassette sub-family G member 1-like n=1 Tax=Harmonia axyridis TaxID=115357 RepID=UPI001E277C60|nr:ATP-binding cassette sub-family G member 1-like [Harmonia axyridis]